MSIEITMPQQSDTMTEGTVVKWRVKEGEKVKAGQIVAEIETDKAVMEMEAFEGGTLASIVVKEGQKAAVGGVLAVLAGAGETVEDVKKHYAGAAKVAAVATREQGGAAVSVGEMRESADVGHHATREPANPVPPLSPGKGNGHDARTRVSPLARRVAAEHGIDLSLVQGSGPAGRIVQKDVTDYLESRGAAPASAPAAKSAPQIALPTRVAGGQVEKISLSKMRVAIATALQRSKQNVPHFYETIDIDLEQIVDLRQRLNARLEKEKVRLSISDFVTQAVAAALKQHPALNATFDAQKNEVTRYGDVHLGIAVALPDGLIVPVLRNVDQMGLKEIRVRSAELVDRSRGQKLKGEEMRGATFTVSSLGAYGIREFSAIINPPEVGILAIGAAEKRAVVRGEQVVARTMMSVTLSCDHRVVDGATAAEFLRTLKELLEAPGLMLA